MKKTIYGISESPKISVIMPVRNSGIYLEEALASLVRQTFRDFEVICVDDCSKDGITLEILKKYEADAENIRVIHLEKNVGAGEARNIGFRHSSGEYVIFLDSDVVFDEDLLQGLYECVTGNEAQMAVCGSRYLDTGRICHLPEELNKEKEDWVLRISTVPWDKLVQRKFLVGHGIGFQNLTSCNDVYYSLLLYMSADRIAVCGDTLVSYRYGTPGQISSDRNPENIYLAVKKLNDQLDPGNRRDRRAAFAVLIYRSLVEIRACKNELQNEACYKSVQHYLRENQKELHFEDRLLARYLHDFVSKGYETRWFEKAFSFETKILAYIGEIKGRLAESDAVGLWGMGKRGRAFLDACAQEGIGIKYAADRRNGRVGEKNEYGIRIVSTSELLQKADVIVASNHEIYESLAQFLDRRRLVDLEEYC